MIMLMMLLLLLVVVVYSISEEVLGFNSSNQFWIWERVDRAEQNGFVLLVGGRVLWFCGKWNY